MAKVIVPKQIPPKVINKFLGLNENVDGGSYALKLGEASKMVNWRITPNKQLKKREGFWKIFDLDEGDVQGLWYGKLNSISYFLFCHDGHLYSGDLTDGTKVDLGTLTDAPTRFIAFGTKVYLLNGAEYKSFDGVVATPSTDSLVTVAGYRPKIAIGAPPSGGGTLYEQINELTGAKRMTFTPAGSATAYVLPEQNINSVDFVKKDGVTLTVTTHYTVNLTTGVVTFVSGPTGSVPDSIEIGWTKGTGNRDSVVKCRFAMDYSGKTDSRIFIWGDPSNKSRRRWSGLADGIPSAEYFEANSYNDEGSGQYAITDIVKQYDIQKIYLEDSTKWSQYEAIDIDGVTTASFPSYDLNEEIGNVAEGQAQIINNSPVTLFSGVRKWEQSAVEHQLNEKLISERVQDSLMDEDLTTAITVNWEEKKEYWCNIGDKVWIYNYVNDTWYTFDNITATCFLVVDGNLYFGSNGAIHVFDGSKRTDNGTAINAVWEMGFYDADAEWLNKYMNNIWVSIKPNDRARLEIMPVTNTDGNGQSQTITYNTATFEHMTFENFSFLTSINPQPFNLEVEAQGFCYFKLVLSNSSLTETVTVLSITMPIRYGGRI